MLTKFTPVASIMAWKAACLEQQKPNSSIVPVDYAFTAQSYASTVQPYAFTVQPYLI